MVEEDQDHTHHIMDSSLSNSDFNFCFNNSFCQQLSPADELFSNGKILPINANKPSHCGRLPQCAVWKGSDVRNLTSRFCEDVSNHAITNAPSYLRRAISVVDQATAEKKQLKELLSIGIEGEKKPTMSKSFWQFKRSNSLNCDSSTKSKGLMRSFQFLSRSNSTDSAPNLPRQPSVSSRRRSSVSGSRPFYPYSSPSQKHHHALRKCGSYGNWDNARVSPVLNIPPSFISKGNISFFGLGSLFCSGNKVRKKK